MEGYQLVAQSSGLSPEHAAQITRFGPAHDALHAAQSVNFFQLSSDAFCISRSTIAGEEYSGRRGGNVSTRCLVADAAALARFSNNPFRLLEAATLDGVFDEQSTGVLPAVNLLGTAAAVDRRLLAELVRQPGVEALTQLLDAMLTCRSLGVRGVDCLERLLQGALNLLPTNLRPEFSFATGLRPSATRKVRVAGAPPQSAGPHVRGRGLDRVLDLTSERPAPLSHPWSRVVRDALTAGRLSALGRSLKTAQATEETLAQLAQHVEQRSATCGSMATNQPVKVE